MQVSLFHLSLSITIAKMPGSDVGDEHDVEVCLISIYAAGTFEQLTLIRISSWISMGFNPTGLELQISPSSRPMVTTLLLYAYIIN